MGVHKTVNGAYRCRYAPFANILCNGVQPLGDSSWTFTVLRPDWSLNWMALSIMNLGGLLMMRNVLNS